MPMGKTLRGAELTLAIEWGKQIINIRGNGESKNVFLIGI